MKMYVDLQNKLEENLTKEKESIVITAAKLMATSTERFGTKKFVIPEKLKEFPSKRFHEEERPNARKSRICYSFAQDIVYAVPNGKVKTPKSILLRTMIKSLTNNTELINVLN